MKLFPYLSFPGNCEEALNFYKEAFDGEIIQLGRYGESPMDLRMSLKIRSYMGGFNLEMHC